MTPYVHKEAKKEVAQLLKAIKNARRSLETSSKSYAIRKEIIDGYYRRLGELVEAGLIAFLDK